MVPRRPTRAKWMGWLGALAIAVGSGAAAEAYAQTMTRSVLVSGMGVPGHPGFVFGSFSNLSMSESGDVIFLTSLRSPRIELTAVARSSGVTFSVLAFQGLLSPISRAMYQSFSAPSMNAVGTCAFRATLKKVEEPPFSAIIEVEGSKARALVTTGQEIPGMAGARFEEFSPPLVSSAGNVLFSARTGGRSSEVGMFLWTRRGTRSLGVPADLKLAPSEVLEPIYFSRDEAVFVPRGAPTAEATEQFFRALAIRDFQALSPQPAPADTLTVLPARTGQLPIHMLLVVMEGDSVQMVPLVGDPSQPVLASRRRGIDQRPLGRILGQTSGAGGNIIVAATTGDQEGDLAVYCLCKGELARLTSPEDFLPVEEARGGDPIFSFSGGDEHTVSFICPAGPPGRAGPGKNSAAIYVTSLP